MKEKYEGFTPHEQYVLDRAAALCPPPLPHQCFANAQLLCLANDSGKIRYHEGYLVACRKDADGTEVALAELPHAWCTINAKVFDPTSKHFTFVGDDYTYRYRHVETVCKRRLVERIRAVDSFGPVTALPGEYTDSIALSNGMELRRG